MHTPNANGIPKYLHRLEQSADDVGRRYHLARRDALYMHLVDKIAMHAAMKGLRQVGFAGRQLEVCDC